MMDGLPIQSKRTTTNRGRTTEFLADLWFISAEPNDRYGTASDERGFACCISGSGESDSAELF
jgi:hypothetical protein